MRWGLGILVGLMVTTVGSIRGTAIEQKPLPAFRVFATDGTVVESPQLSPQERWLLIYAVPGCQPCEKLLRALRDVQSPRLLARTVLVIGAQASAAQFYLQGTLPSELSGIPWYADAQGEAWRALGVKSAPVLIAVRRGRMEWVISGLLKDPVATRSAIRTWVEY